MMKYESKKNPGTFLTTDGVVDPKTKTLFVTLEDGKEKAISISTLKRWWTKVEDAEPAAEEAEPATEETETPTAEEAETPAAEEAEAPAAEEATAAEPADPMKMSDTIKTLELIFDKLNMLYFDNTLPKAVITVQSTPKAYGHCSTKQIWKSESEAMYEINIGAEFINRPIQNTAATLCHEMIHLYCLLNNISDTCQKGRYHNGTFRKEGEARDLILEYDRANGWTHTSPSETFVKKLSDAGIDMSIKFACVMPAKKVRAERAVQHKYVCPCCGQSVKSAAVLNIICGFCNETMKEV